MFLFYQDNIMQYSCFNFKYYRIILKYSCINRSLSGRSDVIFTPKVRHFTTVPMIVYPSKVSSEHLVDDVGTGLNHHRSDPKDI